MGGERQAGEAASEGVGVRGLGYDADRIVDNG